MLRSNGVVAIVFICLVITFWADTGQAQQHVCTTAEGRRVMDEADRVRTWNALYKSYRLYRQCDDGAIAEGYSESVARILVDHWKSLTNWTSSRRRMQDFATLSCGTSMQP